MTIGDDALAEGMALLHPTDKRWQGYEEINRTRDYLALRTNAEALEANAERYIGARRSVMDGKDYFVALDSYGTTVAGIEAYAARIATEHAMNLVNVSVPGAFFQDIAGNCIGTASPIGVNVAEGTIVHIGSALNPALNRGVYEGALQGELDSMEALIWLACSTERLADSTWATTGSWSDYSGPGAEFMSGGSAKVSSSGAAYATTTPAAGDYVAFGYNLTENDPNSVTFSTGTYLRGSTEIYARKRTGAPSTQLGNTITPRPVRLFGLTGSEQIRVNVAPDAGYTFVDGLIKLGDNPPWIAISLPTYVGSTSYDAAIDLYRRRIMRRVHNIVTAYPPLRGKIILIDPVSAGWNRDIHLASDATHPNEAGALFLQNLAEREIAVANAMRPRLMAS